MRSKSDASVATRAATSERVSSVPCSISSRTALARVCLEEPAELFVRREPPDDEFDVFL